MLHLVTVRHTAASCPGRAGNEEIHPCLHAMDEMLKARGIGIVGRWADPPAHVSYLVLDAPDAHAVQSILMESGVASHTTSEIRPVVGME